MFVGIDFGTTNSAVAHRGAPAGRSTWSRSVGRGRACRTGARVLFFEPGGGLTAGAPAIARYLETEGDGRLVQSIKSHLASASFTSTHDLRAAVDARGHDRGVPAADPRGLAGRPRRALRGRPAGALLGRRGRGRRRARARADARRRSRRPGFDEVVFEYEPVGAAARYAARLDHDELIVVADFGGGTTDFSVIRVGPTDPATVLATGGIGVSGDAFDARVIDAVVAPALGRGSRYVDRRDGRRGAGAGVALRPPAALALPVVPQGGVDACGCSSASRAARSSPRGSSGSSASSTRISGSRCTARSKARRSGCRRHDEDRVALDAIELDLPVTRAGFEAWIADDLDAIDRVLEDVLARAGVEPRARSIACSRPAAARSCRRCARGSPRGSAPTSSSAARVGARRAQAPSCRTPSSRASRGGSRRGRASCGADRAPGRRA